MLLAKYERGTDVKLRCSKILSKTLLDQWQNFQDFPPSTINLWYFRNMKYSRSNVPSSTNDTICLQ